MRLVFSKKGSYSKASQRTNSCILSQYATVERHPSVCLAVRTLAANKENPDSNLYFHSDSDST